MASLDKFRDNPGIQRYPKNEMDWKHFINETAKWIADSVAFATAQTDIVTSQTSADNAGSYWIVTPASQVWNSDSVGVHKAGDPEQDILFTLYDKSGSAVATRTLKGTMTTASGNITITTTGTPTGLTTAATFDPATNADVTVKANMKATFADGSESIVGASWSSVDISVAGGTPASGGGK